MPLEPVAAGMDVPVPAATDPIQRDWVRHAGWGGPGGTRIGTGGFTLPDPALLEPVALTEANRAGLLARGVTFRGPPDPTNIVWLPRAGGSIALVITLKASARRSTVVVGPCVLVNLHAVLRGSGTLTVVAGGAAVVRLKVLHNAGGALFVGRDTAIERATLVSGGPGRAVQVGDDCLLDEHVAIRASDAHAVLDLDQGGAIVNPPAGSVIGPHVWLQERAHVLKGVIVGRGAIVADGAVVTRDVPPCSMVAGAPARVTRERVTWSHEAEPDAAAVARAIRWAGEGT